eukprot:3807565-Pyramimonas_sp.AAC.1
MDVAQYVIPRCRHRPPDRPSASNQEEEAPNIINLTQRAVQRAQGKRLCVEVCGTPSQGMEMGGDRPAKAARQEYRESL